MTPELDAAIGRAMGVEPRIEWAASSDGGESLALWTTDVIRKSDVERFCAEHREYSIVRQEHYPPYSTDDGAAMQVVRWMRGQGWDYGSQWLSDNAFDCWFGAKEKRSEDADFGWGAAKHESPAMAIALAFCAAMGVEVERQIK